MPVARRSPRLSVAPIPFAPIAWAVAWAMLVVNALALIGWAVHGARLVQPLAGFPPERPTTCIAFVSIALGLLALVRRRPVALLTAGLIAFLLGGITLFALVDHWAFALDAPLITTMASLNWGGSVPDRVAASSALFAFLGGANLVMFAVPESRRDLAHVIIGILGSITLALAATVMAGHVGGFLHGIEFGPMVGSSIQSEVSALALGALLLAIAWRQDATLALPPWWLPFALGAASLVTVLFLWKALVDRERTLFRQQVTIALRATRRHLAEQLTVIEGGVRRTARVSLTTDMAPEAWSSNIGGLVRDLDGLTAVAWFDRDGLLHNATPTLDAGAALMGPLTAAGVFTNPVTAVSPADSGRPAFRYLRLPGAEVAIVLPVCGPELCGGSVVGVVDPVRLFRPIMADTLLGFHFALQDGDEQLTSSAPRSTEAPGSSIASNFRLGEVTWTIVAWPTAGTLSQSQSELPDLVLVLGLIVSGLLPITLRLAQSAGRAAQAEERARINLAFERATDGIWEWDIATDAATRSATLWRYLGYEPAAMGTRSSAWTALIHPEDRTRVQSALTEHLIGRSDAYEAQYRLRAQDGSWHTIADRGRVVTRAPNGNALRILGISADVTERRRSEEALKEMDTLSTMGRLAARVAHEINNPLGGIQNSFLLVKDAIPDSHPHFKYVGAIEREIARIATITRQLYETYRPEQDRTTDAPVHMLVGDAVSFLEQVNRNRHVTIAVDLSGSPAVVPVPDSLLRQCLYNLVQNAIEASPDGSTVTLVATREREVFVLRVRDEGPGIPLDMRARIFEPFFSTKDASVKTGGMGLGLALVHRSVHALGGTIEIADAPGGGAEFTVRLPITRLTLGDASP